MSTGLQCAIKKDTSTQSTLDGPLVIPCGPRFVDNVMLTCTYKNIQYGILKDAVQHERAQHYAPLSGLQDAKHSSHVWRQVSNLNSPCDFGHGSSESQTSISPSIGTQAGVDIRSLISAPCAEIRSAFRYSESGA